MKIQDKNLKFALLMPSCMISSCLFAQTIKVGQYKIDHHTYSVSTLGQGGSNRLFIQEKDTSSARKGKKNSNWTYAYVELSSKDAIKDAFVKMLGMERIKKLMPEKDVLLSLFSDTNGTVLAVNYYLRKNSKLTLKEINALTTFIKKNVSFKVPTYIKKGSKLLPFSYAVKFNAFADSTKCPIN